MEEQDDKNRNDDRTSRLIGRCMIRLALYTIVGRVLGEVGSTVLEVIQDMDTAS